MLKIGFYSNVIEVQIRGNHREIINAIRASAYKKLVHLFNSVTCRDIGLYIPYTLGMQHCRVHT